METELNMSKENRDLPQIMYEVPGYGEPNIDRYLESRTKSELVFKRLRLPFEFADLSDNPDGQFQLLNDALSSEDLQLQEVATTLISKLNEYLQRPLLDKAKEVASEAMSSDDPKHKAIGLAMLELVTEELPDAVINQLSDYIEQSLVGSDKKERLVAAQLVESMPYGEQRDKCYSRLVESIGSGLSSLDVGEQTMAVELIPYCNEDDIANLVALAFEKGDDRIQEATAVYIKRLPAFVAESLIRKILQSEKPNLQRIGAEAATKIYRVHTKQPDMPSDISELVVAKVAANLESDDFDKQLVGADMLEDVPDAAQLAKYISFGMGSHNPVIQKKAVRAIRYLQKDPEQSRSTMPDLVLRALHSKQPILEQEAVAVSRHLLDPEKTECMNEIFSLVKDLIHSDSEDDRRHGAAMLYYINHPQASELFEVVETDSVMLESLMYSRLYPYESEEPGYMRRVNFDKTGSGMSVLRGGTLDHKILLRHVKQRTFVGWIRAFEDYETWLDAGFDYVPVEPIQSFVLNKNNSEAAVSAGLLDIDLGHWLKVSGGRFEDELLERYEKIKDVLRSMGIKHGHPHMDNFFLRFERREDGTIDTHKLPHIYVGDFDKSQTKVNFIKDHKQFGEKDSN